METVGQHADTAQRTMQAIMQDGYGSPDVLRLGRTARPHPTDHEVLLQVRAAGLDRGAWHLMTGRPYAMRLATGLRAPKQRVPGREVAGTVVEVGASVTRFAVGDEVFGIAGGAFAEYAAARADKLARKPANITFAQAAVVSVSALTALQALTDVGRVEAGQRVLIIGASGGVGSYAVQLAKAFGAEVTGVSSAAKLDWVRSLGADHVIDYTRDDFATGGIRYDLILDIGGNPSPTRLRRALAPKGTAVIAGGEEGGNLTGGMDRQLRALTMSLFVGQRLTGMLCKERATDLERLAELVEAGKVTPHIDRTYPLAEVPDAMRRLAAGQARGKIAITI
jgi:NADPH:quinone reductase-like Zn-dependent oxidoreductase